MPLRALIDSGDEVIAPLLDDIEWDDLVRQVKSGAVKLTMPCCEMEARPRVSSLGTRHFFHRRRPEDCDYVGESFDHLHLKADIVRIFDGFGWQARTEVPGEGWRADVLAENGDRRAVFEIQLSQQDRETSSRADGSLSRRRAAVHLAHEDQAVPAAGGRKPASVRAIELPPNTNFGLATSRG